MLMAPCILIFFALISAIYGNELTAEVSAIDNVDLGLYQVDPIEPLDTYSDLDALDTESTFEHIATAESETDDGLDSELEVDIEAVLKEMEENHELDSDSEETKNSTIESGTKKLHSNHGRSDLSPDLTKSDNTKSDGKGIDAASDTLEADVQVNELGLKEEPELGIVDADESDKRFEIMFMNDGKQRRKKRRSSSSSTRSKSSRTRSSESSRTRSSESRTRSMDSFSLDSGYMECKGYLDQCHAKTRHLTEQFEKLNYKTAKCESSVKISKKRTGKLVKGIKRTDTKIERCECQREACCKNLTRCNQALQNYSIADTCRSQAGGITLYKLANGKVYYYSNTSATPTRTWAEAKAACESYGMELVTVDSDTLKNMILALINPASGGGSSAPIWVGANDIVTEGTVVWDATGALAQITLPVAPAANSNNANNNCVQLDIATGAYGAMDCTTALNFMCEVSANCTNYVASITYP